MAPYMKALVTVEGKTATVKEVDIPKPREGEILVKIHYVAQNPTDWKAMKSVQPGRIIGCDFAGIVEDGNGSRWHNGERVSGFVQGSSVDPTRGVFAEYAVIEASLVYAIPDEVSYQDAAVIPLAFATAVQAIFGRLKIPEPSSPAKNGFPFLVSGGTSSVGQYAVQLAKMAGAFVVATGSARNHELLKSLGADAVVDYKDPDWPEHVRKLTHDHLEFAFDCISENGTTEAIVRSLSPEKGGHVVAILPVNEIRDKIENEKIKLESTIVYTVFERPRSFGAFDNCGYATPGDKALWEKYLAILPELLSSGKLKPNRARELGGLDDILSGFEKQQDGNVSAEKLVYKIT
ncbi:zinc-binding dehydrogenase [Annulohypoxylon maeteangense]|uniref:zinc-binding dehydrogenase n=1 Tax=Annulohypoxylon maeteangense TaxID=1927788 RepID=UPI002008480B|nr:zinc-binding dehydrogenase [Annulohypoxylon maeteangense]KAI0880207.1 zinc-binding dehydrogenase [Annulohypoxylon maeteangense]